MRSWMRLTAVMVAGSLAGKVLAQAAATPAREKPETVERAVLDREVVLQYQLDKAQAEQQQAVKAYRDVVAGRMKVRTENAAYLGAGVIPVIPAVREQMGLGKGVGLVVNRVEAGSPAETAGIKVNDILEKFNDQLLVNLQQLTVLVRSAKGGDEIKLTIIRGGEHQTVPVKLVEKEVPVMNENANWAARADWTGAGNAPVPPQPAGYGAMPFPGGGDAELTIGGPKGDFRTKVRAGGRQEQTFDDGKYKINITNDNGRPLVVVTDDATGKVIADGVKTDEEWKKTLTPEVAAALKKMDEVVNNNQARIQLANGDRLVGGRMNIVSVPTNAQNRRLPRIPSTKLDAITWSDEEHTFDVTASKNSEKRELHLVAKNAEGTIVFDGQINTDEEKQGLPKDIAEKLISAAVAQVLDVMRGNMPGLAVDPAGRPVRAGGGAPENLQRK